MGPPSVVLPVVLVSVVVPDAPPALAEAVPPAVVAVDIVVVSTPPPVPVVAVPEAVELVVAAVPVLATAAESLPFVLLVVPVLVAVMVSSVEAAVEPSIVSWLSAAGSPHPIRTPRLKRAPAALAGSRCSTNVGRSGRKALKRESIVASELQGPFGSSRQCRFEDGSFKKR